MNNILASIGSLLLAIALKEKIWRESLYLGKRKTLMEKTNSVLLFVQHR